MSEQKKYKSPNFVSCVVQVCNNEKIIEKKLQALLDYFRQTFKLFEIIIVDNASSDASAAKIKKAAAGCDGTITLIELCRHSHTEAAMQVGIEAAIGDYVYEIDNIAYDFAPKLLDEMYEKNQQGNDVVAAILRNKSAGSKLTNTLLKLITNAKIRFDDEIIRMVSRRALNAASTISDKTRYRKIIYQMIGYNYAVIKHRMKGKYRDGESFRDKLEMFTDIAFSFSNLGLKLSFFLSLIFMLFSIAIFGYVIYSYLFNQYLVRGWTTMMGFLSVSFTGLFILLGIICRYLSMIFKEIRTMPTSIIKSISKL